MNQKNDQDFKPPGSYSGLFIVAGLSLPLAILLTHLLAPTWQPVGPAEDDNV